MSKVEGITERPVLANGQGEVRRGSPLTRRVRRWLERRETEWVATRCGGDQRCPWCRQWMNQFHGTHIEPFDDGMLDEITCGNCGGSSLWKWEIGFMFVAAAEQPAGATQPSNFGDGPFIREVIARARDVLAARVSITSSPQKASLRST